MNFLLDFVFNGFGILLSGIAISFVIIAACIILIRSIRRRPSFGPLSFIFSLIFFLLLCFPVCSLRAGFVFKGKLNDFKDTSMSLIAGTLPENLATYTKEDCERLIDSVDESIPGVRMLTEMVDYEVSNPVATIDAIYISANSYLTSLIWKSIFWIAVITCVGSILLYNTCRPAVILGRPATTTPAWRERARVHRPVERRVRY